MTSSIHENALSFADALPDGGSLMGLDLGTKTLGVAVCDAGWRFANADKTIARGKFAKDCEALRAIVEARRIAGIVLGLPRNMNGSEGPRAQATRAYAANLVRSFDLPILLWDERWSTTSATRDMIGQDMSRAKQKARVDSHAAAVILQGAIDAMTGHSLPGMAS